MIRKETLYKPVTCTRKHTPYFKIPCSRFYSGILVFQVSVLENVSLRRESSFFILLWLLPWTGIFSS